MSLGSPNRKRGVPFGVFYQFRTKLLGQVDFRRPMLEVFEKSHVLYLGGVWLRFLGKEILPLVVIPDSE